MKHIKRLHQTIVELIKTRIAELEERQAQLGKEYENTTVWQSLIFNIAFFNFLLTILEPRR